MEFDDGNLCVYLQLQWYPTLFLSMHSKIHVPKWQISKLAEHFLEQLFGCIIKLILWRMIQCMQVYSVC